MKDLRIFSCVHITRHYNILEKYRWRMMRKKVIPGLKSRIYREDSGIDV